MRSGAGGGFFSSRNPCVSVKIRGHFFLQFLTGGLGGTRPTIRIAAFRGSGRRNSFGAEFHDLQLGGFDPSDLYYAMLHGVIGDEQAKHLAAVRAAKELTRQKEEGFVLFRRPIESRRDELFA